MRVRGPGSTDRTSDGNRSYARWLPFGLSGLFYLVITLVMGRDVAVHIGSVILHDPGDPVFVAALLEWNATHLPYSEAWWQFPIFFPVRDALAFSEHLLGISIIAAPIRWIVGDAIVTYNIVALLTFPLCALAMYALVRHLTGSHAGGFVAGLAFAFSPYRVSQLTHVQMLAVFWAPLALLGLHLYLATGRRRWLALYAGAWMLQAAANLYMLVFFSLLVGLWILWFVVRPGRWHALAAIATATGIAALPLVPIVYRYLQVHEVHRFSRNIDEVRMFSADAAALLCANQELTVWGQLRTACRPEAELFPGAALVVIGLAGLSRAIGGWRATGSRGVVGRILAALKGGLLIAAIFFATAATTVALMGPWQIVLGPLRMSTSSAGRPLALAIAALAGVLLLSPGIRSSMRRWSVTTFYSLAAIAAWTLALGPTVAYLARPSGVPAPFAWVALLPGFEGVRVPARFWLLTSMCLAVVAGVVIAKFVRGRRPAIAAAIVLVATAGLLSDGWTRMVVAGAPGDAPAPSVLSGQIVVEPPTGEYVHDSGAVFRAVKGGWMTVNGWSGYEPNYYRALADAWRAGDDGAFRPFQRLGPVHVVVPRSAVSLVALTERQHGAVKIAGNDWALQYRLPGVAPVSVPAPGRRVGVRAADSPCATPLVSYAADADERTFWECAFGRDRQFITLDAGDVTEVGRLVHVQGTRTSEVPWALRVTTSTDNLTWTEAWAGTVFDAAIEGGLRSPASLRIDLPFTPRAARYVRIDRTAGDPMQVWSVAELELWTQ